MESEKVKKKKGYTLKTLLNINSYIFKYYPVKYVLYIFLNVFTVIQTVVTLKATQFTTNAVYRLFTGTSRGFSFERNGVILYGAGLLVLYIISVLRQLLLKKLTLDISYKVEKDLNLKLSRIWWDYFEHHETSLKIHEVRTKSLEAVMKLLDSSMFYITTFVSIFAYGYFLSQINIFVVAVYLALVVISSNLAGKVFDEVRSIWDELQPYSQKQDYFFRISGDRTRHQEYRFNRLFPFVRDKWDSYFDKEYKLRIRIFKKYEVTLQAARIILNLPYIMMLIFVSYEIVIGKHDIGFLMLCQAMFNNIVNTFGSVQWYIGSDRVEAKFVKSFFDILKLREEQGETAGEMVKGDIHFDSVEFSYPQAKSKALDGLDFHIRRGEKIAVVGHNGSGKTTFTNLLMCLTENFDGSIKAGDRNFSEIFSGIRSSISCILQDFSQYQMTIKENIEMGDIDRKFSDEEILVLLEKVGLKDLVLSFPESIYTKLGQLDKGIELSKGQWQRVAIARLLAKDKATIWILDEPTAYLDPISEIELYDLIYQLAGDRTVFFISHRLGFAKKADRIVVFESGRILENGTHSELIKMNGRYAEMYKNQEDWYAA